MRCGAWCGCCGRRRGWRCGCDMSCPAAHQGVFPVARARWLGLAWPLGARRRPRGQSGQSGQSGAHVTALHSNPLQSTPLHSTSTCILPSDQRSDRKPSPVVVRHHHRSCLFADVTCRSSLYPCAATINSSVTSRLYDCSLCASCTRYGRTMRRTLHSRHPWLSHTRTPLQKGNHTRLGVFLSKLPSSSCSACSSPVPAPAPPPRRTRP